MFWLIAACKGVDPAPTELDALLHFLWQEYDEGDEELLAEALVNLDRAVDGERIEDPTDGTLDPLSRTDAGLVGVTNRDPAQAAGVFMTRTLDCGWDQLEEVLSFPDQSELYDGVYESYGRTFDAPRDAWLRGDAERVDYDIDYSAKMLGTTYEAHSRGALRRIGPLDDEATPFGAFLVQRSFMPEPAAFEEGSNKSMSQDYQIEIYWARGPGQRVVHAYGMWRQADFGGGFDSDDEGTQRILLNELIAWDDDTEQLCAEGRP